MSIDRGMDKEDVVHIYNGILLIHYKEQNEGSLKTELPYDPAIPLLCIFLEKNMSKRIYAPQYSLRHYLQ